MSNRIIAGSSLILCAFSASFASADDRTMTSHATDELRVFTPADVFDLASASQPQISPDGRFIVYTRRENDIQTDQTLATLWLFDRDTGEERRIAGGETPAASPRWAPDSQAFAYVQSGEAPALMRFDIETGVSTRVTGIGFGANGLTWSPDGQRLAFASFVPAAGLAPQALPERPDGADWAAPAQIDDRIVFRIDGVGPLPRGRNQIFIVSAEGGTALQVTEDAYGASADFTWSADSRSLIVSVDRRLDTDTSVSDTELYRLDLDDGSLSALTDRRGPDNAPRLSPDGQNLAWLGYDDRRMGYHNTELYIGKADGTDARSISADLDRAITQARWSEDSEHLFISYIDHGRTHLAQIDLDGQIIPVRDDLMPDVFGRPYSSGSWSVSASNQLAYTWGDVSHPSEIAVLDTPLDEPQILTDFARKSVAGITFGRVEQMDWTTPVDGLEAEGWIIYPPDFDPDQLYPMILEIHGGPFSSYGPVFTGELQLMAARGYVVLYTNPRGSTGYGYEFANEIHHNYPGQDYDDLIAGVDALIDRGFIDEDRLFVTGGSGGGVLTAWIIGNTDRFAAAGVIKPVINWSSFVLHSDLPNFFYRYWFGEAPWENPDEYWRRSPLSLVGNVDTPTLMMVGGADSRTPRSETEQYYSALQLRNVPTRLVVIPDTPHGIANSRPSRLLTKVEEILHWFETHDPARVDETDVE